MKKTLFLGVILGAALCSSAFADTIEITANGQLVNLQQYTADDTLVLNLTGTSYLAGQNAGTYTTVANLEITSMHIDNGWSNGNTHVFTGSISGSGAIERTARQRKQYWVFTGDMSNYTGALTVATNGQSDDWNQNTLTFGADNGTMTVGASSVTASGMTGFNIKGNVTFTQANIDLTSAVVNLSGTMTLNADATLKLASDETWQTGTAARTEGNGYALTTKSKDFGTHIVSNGASFFVDGNAANLSNGVVTVVTGTSETDNHFYVNNAAGSFAIEKDSLMVSNLGDKTFTGYFSTTSGSTLTLTDGQSLTMGGAVNMGVWMDAETSIVVENGASLTNFGLTFTDATITANGSSQLGDHGNTESSRHNIVINGDVTINSGKGFLNAYSFGEKATVTVNSGTTTQINSALSVGTTLTVNDGSEVTFSKDAAVAAFNGEGALTLGNHELTVKADSSIGSLTLGSGATITIADHNGSLITSNLTVEGDADLNANLVVNGGTIKFHDEAILTMGCDVTIGAESAVTVVLTDTMVQALQSGGTVDLIKVSADDVVTLGAIQLTDALGGIVNGRVECDGNTVYVTGTPEPATTTLSLLALAALAARRKRH